MLCGAARYAEDLKKFHLLQAEYLMIVWNNIKDFGDLVDYKLNQKTGYQNIDSRQKSDDMAIQKILQERAGMCCGKNFVMHLRSISLK